MGMGFTSYIVENDEKFSRAIERSIGAVKDLKKPFAMIAKDFRKSRTAIFTLKGPGAYPDLSPKYKKRKERIMGSAYPILKFSGALADSVTNEGDGNNITRINADSMELGTAVSYGIYHQSDSPRSKIPLRKFLFIGSESVKFANSEISGFPERALNTLNSYVLSELGANIEQATGVKPQIRKGKI